jgi:hypothetical protein
MEKFQEVIEEPMYKRLILFVGFATLVQSACGTLTTRVEGTPVAGTTELLNTIPAATFTLEVPSASTMTISPAISTPTTTQPADTYLGWNTFNSGDYTFKYPPSFYNPIPIGPVFYITDSKTTYDSWTRNTLTNSELMIMFMSLNLDRKLDPDNNPGLLVTPELALKREINMQFGIPYLVSGSTNVPWENANGGTADGRKWFYPNVTYENIMLGSTKSAKVISDGETGYFILNPSDDSYYVRFSIKPAGSTLFKVADQILSSFRFSH